MDRGTSGSTSSSTPRLIINPEGSTATEVVSLLRRAAASDVLDLAGGRLQLVGLRVDGDSPVVGEALQDLAHRASHLTFRIMGVVRGARTIVARGDERLQKDDQVFVVVEAGQVPQVVHTFGKSGARLENIMILGGSRVANRIAARLSDENRRRGGLKIKLVEQDEARAQRLAEQLKGVLVLHGDPSDMDLFVVEGISEMDAFVAV